MQLNEIFQQMGIRTKDPLIGNQTIFSGGPVHRERGFILHPTGSKWDSTVQISTSIALTTSPDILKALSENRGPKECLVALGYSYWEPGLLEKELSQNAWIYGPANPEVLFQVPIEQRWRAAAAILGIDTDKISDEIGHA